MVNINISLQGNRSESILGIVSNSCYKQKLQKADILP